MFPCMPLLTDATLYVETSLLSLGQQILLKTQNSQVLGFKGRRVSIITYSGKRATVGSKVAYNSNYVKYILGAGGGT